MKDILSKVIGNKEKFPVQHRVFNATLFAGVLLTGITGLGNFLMGLNPATYIYAFICLFLFSGLYIYSIKGKNFYQISLVCGIFTFFIYSPLYWFINGGTQGGFQYFSVLYLIIIITTIPKHKHTFLVLYTLSIVGILCVEYFFPDLVIKYDTRSERYIDLGVSFIILNTSIYLVLKIFLRLYENSNIKLLKQKEELQATRRQLEEKNKELNDINKTKDKFFSIIAHDLRGPFHSMLGFSNLLNDYYDDYSKEEKKEFFGVIHSNIQSTYKLLDNLLIWARSQQGDIDFNPEEENLSLLSLEISELVQLSAKNKSISLKMEIPQHISVYVDKFIFSTILRNLLSNALKFTKRNGEVIVSAEENGNGYIHISVQDNGIGMSKEVQSKLFNKSQVITYNGTENEPGTGLGLFLCKEFVEKHGGDIWVESEPDKGSCFNFTVPVCMENINNSLQRETV